MQFCSALGSRIQANMNRNDYRNLLIILAGFSQSGCKATKFGQRTLEGRFGKYA